MKHRLIFTLLCSIFAPTYVPSLTHAAAVPPMLGELAAVNRQTMDILSGLQPVYLGDPNDQRFSILLIENLKPATLKRLLLDIPIDPTGKQGRYSCTKLIQQSGLVIHTVPYQRLEREKFCQQISQKSPETIRDYLICIAALFSNETILEGFENYAWQFITFVEACNHLKKTSQSSISSHAQPMPAPPMPMQTHADQSQCERKKHSLQSTDNFPSVNSDAKFILSGNQPLNLGLLSAPLFLTLQKHTLTRDLLDMPVKSNGEKARYTIGARSIYCAAGVINSLSADIKAPYNLTQYEINSFLIVVSAALKKQQDPTINENPNVGFKNDAFIAYDSNGYEIANLNLSTIITVFKEKFLPSLNLMKIDSLPTLKKDPDSYRDILQARLIAEKKFEHYIVCYPKGYSDVVNAEVGVPYILLELNETTGAYQFPIGEINARKYVDKK